jgi:hypothetical protein
MFEKNSRKCLLARVALICLVRATEGIKISKIFAEFSLLIFCLLSKNTGALGCASGRP